VKKCFSREESLYTSLEKLIHLQLVQLNNAVIIVSDTKTNSSETGKFNNV
jgi:hypothetical protein